ncbi:phasin family protein [Malikia sp.]|uniref:phasin family protein n=1 Tax=Malikia sp. TaxID=2070706 RepID=UPI00261798B9|nr:phasin family protein [Malikia sp.]MDD2728488.1 phasin family protein [Malikia sp.]
MINTEQLFSSYKTNIEQMLASNPAAPESVKKLVELNLKTAEAAVDDASKLAQAMTSAKNPQELMDLQASVLKSVTERTMSYSQKLVEIVSSTASDVNLGKFAQGFGGAGQQPFMAAFENMTKSAPAGTEPMIAAMKNAMSAATSAMETMQKTVTQATSQAQSSFNAMTGAAAKGGKNA